MSRKNGYLETAQDLEDQGHGFRNAHEIHSACEWLRSAMHTGEALPHIINNSREGVRELRAE